MGTSVACRRLVDALLALVFVTWCVLPSHLWYRPYPRFLGTLLRTEERWRENRRVLPSLFPSFSPSRKSRDRLPIASLGKHRMGVWRKVLAPGVEERHLAELRSSEDSSVTVDMNMKL